MPIYSENKFSKLKSWKSLPYGSGNGVNNTEFPSPSFALFFKNPPYDTNPQVTRNFCFDDDYGNVFKHESLPQYIETTQFRFRRVFKLNKTKYSGIDFIYPQQDATDSNKVLFKRSSPKYSKVKMDRGVSGHNMPHYLAPWIGIPIDLDNEVSVSVTIPASNAWRLHGEGGPHDQILDSYWRTKLPNKNSVKLELYSPNNDITATWQRNSNSILDFDFSHDSLIDRVAGTYVDTRHTNNVFDENVVITLRSSGGILQNQDVPRKLYIIWKKKSGKDEIVGSISILPFPVIDHYVWYINVTQTATNTWEFMPLRTGIRPLVPAAIDIDNSGNYNPLGTVTRNVLRNEYGINLITLDQVNVQLQSFRDDTLANIGPPTPLFNAVSGGINVFNDNNPSSWVIGPDLPRQFANGINSTFGAQLRTRNLGPLTVPVLGGGTAPVIGPDGITPVSILQSPIFNITSPAGVNLTPLRSNLSIIYLCNSLNGFFPPPPMTLGLGSVPGGTNPIPNPAPSNLRNANYYYGDDDCQKYRNVSFSFPGSVYLFDSELTNANGLAGVNNPIQSNRTDGGTSCHRESVLTHELLHNFGLSHVFADAFTAGNQTLKHFEFVYQQFRNNLQYWYGNRLRRLPANTYTSWYYHKEEGVINNLATLRDFINQITSSNNQDLSFHYLDFISYYGFNDLVRIFHQGRNNILQGYNNPDGLLGLYQQPGIGDVSIPYSNVYQTLGGVTRCLSDYISSFESP